MAWHLNGQKAIIHKLLSFRLPSFSLFTRIENEEDTALTDDIENDEADLVNGKAMVQVVCPVTLSIQICKSVLRTLAILNLKVSFKMVQVSCPMWD